MSSHVWNRKPSVTRAKRMASLYRYARAHRIPAALAVAFAGYVEESTAQKSCRSIASGRAMRWFGLPEPRPEPPDHCDVLFQGLCRSRFRALQRPEYTLVWNQHVQAGLLPALRRGALSTWQVLYTQLSKELTPEVYYVGTGESTPADYR